MRSGAASARPNTAARPAFASARRSSRRARGRPGETIPGPMAYVEHNRAYWDRESDSYQLRHGPQLKVERPGWGVWQIPEDEVRALGQVDGLDVLELGCGAAQWSIYLARNGAHAVGLDVSEKQLEHARKLMAEA